MSKKRNVSNSSIRTAASNVRPRLLYSCCIAPRMFTDFAVSQSRFFCAAYRLAPVSFAIRYGERFAPKQKSNILHSIYIIRLEQLIEIVYSHKVD